MTHLNPLGAVRSALKASSASQHAPTPGSARGVVTISREAGTGAVRIAEAIAAHLNEAHPAEQPWLIYDRNLVHMVAEEAEVADEVIEQLDERDQSMLDEIFADVAGKPTTHTVGMKMARVIRGIGRNGRAIVLGRGGAVILGGSTNVLHVRLTAPQPWRARAHAAAHGMSVEDATKQIDELDHQRADYIKSTLNHAPDDPDLYDLVINVSRVGHDLAAEMIARAIGGLDESE